MSIQFLAYFDPLGFSVLSPKERTTVERNIKQLLKDIDDGLQNINSNHSNQTNTTQTSSPVVLESSQDNPSTIKSTFSSFLHSVSSSATKKRSTNTTTTNHSNSITDEVLLYKSLASKEVQKIVETGSNPDASGFW